MSRPIDTMLRPAFPLPTMGYPPHPYFWPLYCQYPDPHKASSQSYPSHIYGAYGQVFPSLRHHMAQQGFPAPFGHGGRDDYPYPGWSATQYGYHIPQWTKSSPSPFDTSSVAGDQEPESYVVHDSARSTTFSEPDTEMSDADDDDKETNKVSKSRLSKALGCNDFKEITLVLLESPSRTLRLKQIYEALQARHACLSSGDWWHGRVRYLLSVKKRFVLVDSDENDDDDDDQSARGKWHVDLSLKGNRPRYRRAPKLSTGKASSRKKSASKAKSTHKSSAPEKASRKTSSTRKSEVKQQKKARAKEYIYGRGSRALPRVPPTMSPEDRHQEVQLESRHVRLPPVSTLLDFQNSATPPPYRDLQHPFTLWGPGAHMDPKQVTPRKETIR